MQCIITRGKTKSNDDETKKRILNTQTVRVKETARAKPRLCFNNNRIRGEELVRVK